MNNEVDITGIFDYSSSNVIIKVKDQVAKDWILSMSSENRPSSWTEDNIVIVA